jgi:C-terminal processing protease CtpA/Prc
MYVFPDVAAKVVAALKEHVAKKDYDQITSAQEFARRVTSDMQAVANDRHLRMSYGMIGPMGPSSPEERERMRLEHLADDQSRNFGFDSVQRLAGNIGYLDLRNFLEARDAGDTAAAAMNFLSNCDAVIFDLRKNGGGSPSMIDLLISYLYPRGARVHLNDFRQRNTEEREQYWTLPWVPGKTLAGKDVYVLTSKRTFSAAEEFTYDIQTQKRGTIVGEVTGGGANPGGGVQLGNNFGVFIPFGSAYNPITKTNWEGVGVKPDVQVAAEDALKVAHLMALRKMASREGPPRLKQEVKATLDLLEKEAGSKVPATASN